MNAEEHAKIWRRAADVVAAMDTRNQGLQQQIQQNAPQFGQSCQNLCEIPDPSVGLAYWSAAQVLRQIADEYAAVAKGHEQ